MLIIPFFEIHILIRVHTHFRLFTIYKSGSHSSVDSQHRLPGLQDHWHPIQHIRPKQTCPHQEPTANPAANPAANSAANPATNPAANPGANPAANLATNSATLSP